jgi:hypothetical protein
MLAIPAARSSEVFCGVLLLVLLVFVMRWVESSYDHYREFRHDGSQVHYEAEPVALGEVIYWADLGKGRLVHERVTGNAGSVVTESMYPSEYWPREVFWSLRSSETGRITVPVVDQWAEGAQVGIFVSDGDSYSRVGIAWSGEEFRALDDLHDGRWFWFDVTSRDRLAGTKVINVRRLMGPDVAISAVVVVEPG